MLVNDIKNGNLFFQDKFANLENKYLPSMEVHHHPHTHKKSFKEYFLEFLMLFLAVTLGFLAENLREKVVENHRMHEYARSLYDDLKKDSNNLNDLLTYRLWKAPKIDSLIGLIKSNNLQTNTNLIYKFHLITWINYSRKTSDATMQQLRNSGSLRYIKNIHLYNSITEYYFSVANFIEQTNRHELTGQISPSIISKIFRTDILASMQSVTPDVKDAVQLSDNSPQLRTTDPDILNEYFLYIQNKKIATEVEILNLNRALEKLKELTEALKKEYNL